MLRTVAPVLLGSLLVAGCHDLRSFEGAWSGPRVGDDAVREGFADAVTATLDIDEVDRHHLVAQLTTDDGLFDAAAIAPIPGAEADVLSTATFEGAPQRVFLSFADASDGGGTATVVIALYDEDRVETRILRGGATALYGIFDLAR